MIYALKLLRYQKMASEQELSDFIRRKQQSFNLIRLCVDLRKYKTENLISQSISPSNFKPNRTCDEVHCIKFLWNIGLNSASLINYIIDNDKFNKYYREIIGTFGQPRIFICKFDKKYNPINDEELNKLYEFIELLKTATLSKKTKNYYQNTIAASKLNTEVLTNVFLYFMAENSLITSWVSLRGQEGGPPLRHQSKTPYLLRNNPMDKIKEKQLQEQLRKEKQEEYLKLKAEEEEKDKFFNDLKNRAEETEDWEDLCDI